MEQLRIACEDGNVEGVKQLLQGSEIDINLQDSRYSRTPFYIACEHGLLSQVNINRP